MRPVPFWEVKGSQTWTCPLHLPSTGVARGPTKSKRGRFWEKGSGQWALHCCYKLIRQNICKACVEELTWAYLGGLSPTIGGLSTSPRWRSWRRSGFCLQDRVDNYFLNIYSVSMIDIPMMTIMSYIQNVFFARKRRKWGGGVAIGNVCKKCKLCSLPPIVGEFCVQDIFLDVYIMIMIAS